MTFNHNIQSVAKVKYLGVTFDKQLSWIARIDNTIKKNFHVQHAYFQQSDITLTSKLILQFSISTFKIWSFSEG